MKIKHLVHGIALITLWQPIAAMAQDSAIQTKVSTGFDYSKGDYGDTQDTEIWYFPVTAKVSKGNISGKISVPYLSIKGPGSVIGGDDISITQNGTAPVTTQSGLGDVSLSGTYTIDVEPYNTYVDLTGKVKLPTADESKGLGTGETDYTLAADVTKMIGDAYIAGGAGYKFVGDNNTLQLDNIWLANIGAGYQLTPKTGVGVSYDYRQSAGNGDNPSEATGYVTYKLTDSVNVQAYSVIGFSDGSPDNSIGMQIGYSFN